MTSGHGANPIFFKKKNWTSRILTNASFLPYPAHPQTKSRFRPGVYCVKQLLSITHETYKSFDDGLEVEGVFLNVSKTFDKVCHLGLLLGLLTSRVVFKWYL